MRKSIFRASLQTYTPWRNSCSSGPATTALAWSSQQTETDNDWYLIFLAVQTGWSLRRVRTTRPLQTHVEYKRREESSCCVSFYLFFFFFAKVWGCYLFFVFDVLYGGGMLGPCSTCIGEGLAILFVVSNLNGKSWEHICNIEYQLNDMLVVLLV